MIIDNDSIKTILDNLKIGFRVSIGMKEYWMNKMLMRIKWISLDILDKLMIL